MSLEKRQIDKCYSILCLKVDINYFNNMSTNPFLTGQFLPHCTVYKNDCKK